MGPIEIIYNGYTGERQDIDTAETNEAADNLMEMIKSLLPDSGRMQDVLYMECLHLAELSQKQGFMTAFPSPLKYSAWAVRPGMEEVGALQAEGTAVYPVHCCRTIDTRSRGSRAPGRLQIRPGFGIPEDMVNGAWKGGMI